MEDRLKVQSLVRGGRGMKCMFPLASHNVRLDKHLGMVRLVGTDSNTRFQVPQPRT